VKRLAKMVNCFARKQKARRLDIFIIRRIYIIGKSCLSDARVGEQMQVLCKF
jgi:hypothetical protein